MSRVRACGSATPLPEDRPVRDLLPQIHAFTLDLDEQLGVSPQRWSRASLARSISGIACDEQAAKHVSKTNIVSTWLRRRSWRAHTFFHLLSHIGIHGRVQGAVRLRDTRNPPSERANRRRSGTQQAGPVVPQCFGRISRRCPEGENN